MIPRLATSTAAAQTTAVTQPAQPQSVTATVTRPAPPPIGPYPTAVYQADTVTPRLSPYERYVLNREHVAAPAIELLANLHGEVVHG